MEQRNVGFDADYEKRVVTIESSGARTESRELFRLYRDARGRTRMEGSIPAPEGRSLRFAFLTDLQKRRAVVLDLDTGKPLTEPPRRHPADSDNRMDRQPAAEAGALSEARTKDSGESQTVEELGEADIEGLVAQGRRITTASYIVEIWTARAIDQPPLLIRRTEASREKTERLFNVRVREPDPSLFAPLDAP